jgi:hypothetical protein
MSWSRLGMSRRGRKSGDDLEEIGGAVRTIALCLRAVSTI